MPISEGDIFRVKTRGYFGGDLANPILNMFWYKAGTPTGVDPVNFSPLGADAWLDDFVSSVVDAILPAQTPPYEWADIEMVHWSAATRPFINKALSGKMGEFSSTAYMPVWVNYSFRLNRESTVTRNGQKRFAGMPEEAQNAGILVTGFLPTMGNIEDGLETVINYVDGGSGVNLHPCIVRLEAVTGNVLASQFIASAQFTRISTQDSRKR